MAEKKKKTAPKKPASKKAAVKKEEVKVSAKESVEEEKPLSIDISWAAIIVLVAFFAGFMIRGFFASPQTGTEQNLQMPTQPIAPPISSDATMPPGHPAIPGMDPSGIMGGGAGDSGMMGLPTASPVVP